MTPDSLFALICFHILTNRADHSPDYLQEKTLMLGAGKDAFTFLDHRNQARCIAYCQKWKFPVPEGVARYWQDTQEAVEGLEDALRSHSGPVSGPEGA